ncbi:hypothetical protein GGF37_002867 [Kickxella alabastrina]|nr:hypothetical protein GGF37_002867 [Kickxella alabastrina]
MACSLATTTHSRDTNGARTSSQSNINLGYTDIHTGRAYDKLSPDERDSFLGGIEVDFRRYIAETRSSSGFAFYPNSRQIMKAISSLYEALTSIDFSDVFD